MFLAWKSTCSLIDSINDSSNITERFHHFGREREKEKKTLHNLKLQCAFVFVQDFNRFLPRLPFCCCSHQIECSACLILSLCVMIDSWIPNRMLSRMYLSLSLVCVSSLVSAIFRMFPFGSFDWTPIKLDWRWAPDVLWIWVWWWWWCKRINSSIM